ncbi:hypothetical protein PFISCL1PPCAC_12895, partial [Pristionchus fissidentatus]
RLDIAAGAFGGKHQASSRGGKHEPVLFVHGVSSRAGEMMKKAAGYFKTQGYHQSELYATTYENGGKGDKTSWTKYNMKCSSVKQVRAMMVAVHEYTKRKLDIVAFSLGVPIARKAILGGRCVDTNEQLGKPLTHIIDTFVGVAGPNEGVAPVVGGVPLAGCALFPLMPICNPQDGLYSGVCPIKSKFLVDIERKRKYEGKYIYTIGSTQDEIVGHQVCGKVTTRIPHQNGEKLYKNGMKHNQVSLYTTVLYQTCISGILQVLQNPVENGSRSRRYL